MKNSMKKSKTTKRANRAVKHETNGITLTRSQLVSAAILASSGLLAVAATVPNTFSSGAPAVAADVNANFQALAAAVTALETKLASMSLETVNGQPTVRFTGVNVQVVNGYGSTNTVNGTGNLIVGYDETYTGPLARCTIGTNPSTGAIVTDSATCAIAGGTWTTAGFKTGSHYLVLGTQNNYSQWGGLVAGFRNFSNYSLTSVSGGSGNTASGPYASVSGGYLNTASGGSASVSGGQQNTASGSVSSAMGGGGCNVSANFGWDVGLANLTGCSPNVGQ